MKDAISLKKQNQPLKFVVMDNIAEI